MQRTVLASAGAALLLHFPVHAEPDPDTERRCRTMFAWIVSEPVRFVQSRDTLRDSSRQVILRLAEFAHDCPDYVINIRGHTDNVGDGVYNQLLSEQRAEAIATFLAEHGVDRQQLTVSGAGASEPVADNASAWGREQNRRIEFRLVRPGHNPQGSE